MPITVDAELQELPYGRPPEDTAFGPPHSIQDHRPGRRRDDAIRRSRATVPTAHAFRVHPLDQRDPRLCYVPDAEQRTDRKMMDRNIRKQDLASSFSCPPLPVGLFRAALLDLIPDFQQEAEIEG
jgi:hypothetical protein